MSTNKMKIYRSSVDGRFVSKIQIKQNPRQTETETRPRKTAASRSRTTRRK